MKEITKGDCLEVLKAMPAGSIDCMVTDPPYGIAWAFATKRHRKTQFGKMENDQTFDPEWHLAWMKAAYRVLKDGAHAYVFCSEHFVGEFRSTLAEAGFILKRMLIWVKDSHGMGDMVGGYLPMTELILFAHKPAPKGEERALERKRQTNVIAVAGIRKMKFHPTEKPISVLRPLILNSTKVGESVLDPFAGSGSTGVAAREENRVPVLIEINPKYAKVTEDRLAQDGLF